MSRKSSMFRDSVLLTWLSCFNMSGKPDSTAVSSLKTPIAGVFGSSLLRKSQVCLTARDSILHHNYEGQTFKMQLLLSNSVSTASMLELALANIWGDPRRKERCHNDLDLRWRISSDISKKCIKVMLKLNSPEIVCLLKPFSI